jgi:glycosyltransferase involved in cell wall biosynthesis
VAEQPLLSIAISCYTNERLNDVLELLDSVKAQNYPRIETIVVVERSTELLDRIKQYANEKLQLPVKTVFNYGEQGLSAARNLGIKEANGDIIAFVDDDALLLPDWADEMVKSYEDASVIGVTGPISPLWKDELVDWFPSEFDWILGATGFSGLEEIKDVRNVFGANMSFRKEAFSSSGVFLTYLGAKGGGASGKHELVGDETELSMRVKKKTGKRLVFNPGAGIMHKVYKCCDIRLSFSG